MGRKPLALQMFAAARWEALSWGQQVGAIAAPPRQGASLVDEGLVAVEVSELQVLQLGVTLLTECWAHQLVIAELRVSPVMELQATPLGGSWSR